MNEGHVGGHLLQVDVPAAAAGTQGVADGLVIQPLVDPHKDGGAHRAERHRGGLDHHAEQHGSERREADGHQQRSGDGGRGAKARGSLDKGAEAPGDDDGLDAPVRRDVGKAAANGADGACMFQGVEHQDGAEHDPEHGHRDDEPLQAGGEHPGRAHLPAPEGDEYGQDKGDGHGALGGPIEADQQHGGHHDRREGHQGQQGVCHHCVLVRAVRRRTLLLFC